MNIYSLSSIIASIFCLSLGLFVYLSKGRDRMRKLFAFASILTGLWTLFPFVVSKASDERFAIFLSRLVYIPAIFTPSAWLHFMLCVTGDKQKRYVLALSYSISALFLFVCFNQFFIKGVNRFAPHFSVIPGALYSLFIVLFSIIFICILYGIFQSFLTASGYIKNQLKYILLSYVFGFFSGVLHFGAAYFNYEPFPHDFLLIIYTGLIAYAIFTHRLMDIEIIVKRTLVFAGVFASAYAIIAAFTLLGQSFFEQLTGLNRWILLIPSITVIVLILRPLENILTQVTDKYLFQKKYDPRQLIRSFIDYAATVLDLDKIVSETIELLYKAFRPEFSAILLSNGDKYIAHGKKNTSNVIIISNNSAIVAYLKSIKGILSIENDNDKKISDEIRREMMDPKAALAVPLMLRDELIGIILLGKKKSDEYYTQEDLTTLIDLARTVAIAIKNAQLTKQIAEESEKKGIDKTSVGAAHQMKNILARLAANAKLVDTAIRVTETKNINFENAQSLLSLTKDNMQGILKEAEKGKRMLDAILYPAKVKEYFAELNIYALAKQAAESSSRAKSKDILERNIPAPIVTNNVSENFPHIIGNESLIEQILENLINNAFDAVLWRYSYLKPDSSYRGKITIAAEDKGKNIAISIKDNGIGMKDEVKEKIFAGYFTTKSAEHKGDGAGLYSMKGWIEQHKGNISFSSEYGKGTTFTVELPKEQENFNGSKTVNS